MTARFNAFRAVADAAVGDIEAQRALANEAIRITQEEPDIDPDTALREGLVFARLAATHGHNGDKGRVIAMLALAAELANDEGDFETANFFGAEAIARITLMGEIGVDLADETVDRFAREVSADTMAMAQQFERLMREVI